MCALAVRHVMSRKRTQAETLLQTAAAAWPAGSWGRPPDTRLTEPDAPPHAAHWFVLSFSLPQISGICRRFITQIKYWLTLLGRPRPIQANVTFCSSRPVNITG